MPLRLHWPTWLASLTACVVVSACASAPRSPFFGDDKYLRFGVDPRAEADATVAAHQERGEALALRIEGLHFTALGFADREGRAKSVRVSTVRGIALALGGEAAKTPSYALVPSPLPTTQDADGDGFEEVFVREGEGEAACLRVFRVLDVGFVDEVPVGVRRFGAALCADEVEDLDGDGRAELVVNAVLSGFVAERERDGQPRVRFALWAKDHAFVLDAASARESAQLEGERKAREDDLGEARRVLDVARALRLAVELAAISHVAGEPPAAQLRAFDAALSGLVLSEQHAQSAAAARARIRDTWNANLPAPSPGAK